MNVAVLGASDKEDRYSFKVISLLNKAGHKVFPIHKAIKSILNLEVYQNLNKITNPIDTLTIYVNNKISSLMGSDILKLKPARIIFNPGTENSELMKKAQAQGINAFEACTLTMLVTNQF